MVSKTLNVTNQVRHVFCACFQKLINLQHFGNFLFTDAREIKKKKIKFISALSNTKRVIRRGPISTSMGEHDLVVGPFAPVLGDKSVKHPAC